jgi:hypothetical protein
MPSDPTGTHPKGVLTRAAADFFDDNLGTGAFFQSQEGTPQIFNYCTVALFNNANSGVVLKVYGATTISDGGSGMGLYWVHGIVGTFVQNCQPLRPDVGMQYGQIYQQVTLGNTQGAPNPYFTPPPVTILASDGFDSATYFAPYPIFIVPAGWSAVLTNLTPAIDLGAAFWFQQANE